MKAPKICSFLRRTYLYLLVIPVLAIFLGAASNQLVLVANGDKFPVLLNPYEIQKFQQEDPTLEQMIARFFDKKKVEERPKDMLDTVHCVMTKDTHLNALADIIDFGGDHLSIGDLSIQFGEWSIGFTPWLFLFLAVRKMNKQD